MPGKLTVTRVAALQPRRWPGHATRRTSPTDAAAAKCSGSQNRSRKNKPKEVRPRRPPAGADVAGSVTVTASARQSRRCVLVSLWSARPASRICSNFWIGCVGQRSSGGSSSGFRGLYMLDTDNVVSALWERSPSRKIARAASADRLGRRSSAMCCDRCTAMGGRGAVPPIAVHRSLPIQVSQGSCPPRVTKLAKSATLANNAPEQ